MFHNYYRRAVLCLLFGFLLAGCSSHKDLEWSQEEGYRWTEISPGFFGSTGFRQLNSSSTNISFTNRASDQDVLENRNYLSGSGVAAADVDGDGLVDLYFGQLTGPNKLYRMKADFSSRISPKRQVLPTRDIIPPALYLRI